MYYCRAVCPFKLFISLIRSFVTCVQRLLFTFNHSNLFICLFYLSIRKCWYSLIKQHVGPVFFKWKAKLGLNVLEAFILKTQNRFKKKKEKIKLNNNLSEAQIHLLNSNIFNQNDSFICFPGITLCEREGSELEGGVRERGWGGVHRLCDCCHFLSLALLHILWQTEQLFLIIIIITVAIKCIVCNPSLLRRK